MEGLTNRLLNSVQPVCLLTFLWFCLTAFDKKYEEYHLSGFAQGTTWQLVYYAPDSVISKSEIDTIFNTLDRSMSLYRPNSLINRFNLSDKGLQLDPHFRKVIKKALKVNQETKGAFDITVKPLVQAWGFGVKKAAQSPGSERIDSIMRCIGSDQLKLKNSWLIKSRPCVEIDVNGIAQGYSVDVIACFLEKKGVKNFLIELGGEIRVKGRKNNGEHFKIAIETPDDLQESYKQVLVIKKGALTTSGNYRNYKMQGNKKLSHLIDSKTGYPIDNEMISVTVWAKDAISADAYDNALMNMGVKESLIFLKRKKDVEAYFIYKDAQGNVVDTATRGFYSFFLKSR